MEYWIAVTALLLSAGSICASIWNHFSNQRFQERMQDENLEFQKEIRTEDLKREQERRAAEIARIAEQDREQRIAQVVDRYEELDRKREGGIQGLLVAGITDLEFDEEVRTALERMRPRVRADPIRSYRDLFKRVDALEAFRGWIDGQTKQGADFRKYLERLAAQAKE